MKMIHMKIDKKIFGELYPSIQGEGVYIGNLALIIRTFECNLQCSHCDSKFTWGGEGEYTLSDALNFINTNKNKFHHVIITGGEPLLHQSDIITLLETFPSMFFTIETNGTIKPDALLVNLMSPHLWSVSPKLHLWDNTPLLKQIIGWDAFNNAQFKFVITCPEDLNKIKFLVDTQTIEKQIIIQPDGNREDYNIACRELADWVIENELSQVRVLPQFHKICWGNTRGK